MERLQSSYHLKTSFGTHEEAAFQPENLTSTGQALGRLFTLDLLLGNADRLPIQPLDANGPQRPRPSRNGLERLNGSPRSWRFLNGGAKWMTTVYQSSTCWCDARGE